jgi:lon-related putative ATP-dependent protease
MTSSTSLLPEALYQPCDIGQFTFATTAELDDSQAIIGQTRALEAIRFGIGIQREGFNLFALGPNGTGKYTAVRQFLEQKAPAESTPDDWCYVNNFEQPHKPHALHLPPGQAIVLSQDMKRLVEDLFSIIPGAFTSEEYQARKKAIASELKEKEAHALDELRKEALKRNIALVQTPAGFAFAPIKDGEVMHPEEFLRLPVAEQQSLEAEIINLQDSLQKVMHQVPQWHQEMQTQFKQLNEEVATFAVTPTFHELRQKYESLPDVLAYLGTVQGDVVDNVTDFLAEEEKSPLAAMMGLASARPAQKHQIPRYEVNVIVTHDQTQGAPVVYEDQPTYQNLVGRVEHMSQMGALVTDFTLIKPGVLHQANGGYLILDVRKVLLQAYAWEGLKQALRARKIRIEALGQVYGWISTVSLEPEPIPLDVKVVLMGERLLYYLLSYYDPDFKELFKVAADFEDEMARDEANNQAYAYLIAALARKEQLRHFDRAAVARIIEHSARLAGDAARLTTNMQNVTDLLREADFWAGEAGHDVVTVADVQRALDMQIYRAGRLRERLQEAILRETILIDTEGAVIGQINGLSVLMLDNYTFGHPSRITARVRLGKGEVIDIEREVEMGGPIHSKGVLILSGFLGSRYADNRPLSLSATLVFEQSYSGVEGDSASAAELYALLSALAKVPIKQALAVTGSVNQRGRIQAIGGVNEKIEGFFDICRARGLGNQGLGNQGLHGEQGVLIPAANVKNLMLRQDVIEAVAAGQFHIYPIETIDQGIEILTGVPAGKIDEDGNYPADSVNGRVVARLAALAEQQRAFATPPANGKLAQQVPQEVVHEH